MALLESIGDPTLTVGLAFVAFANWLDVGEGDEILRWSQTVIDLAAGDPIKGAGFGIGSPLAAAAAFRGWARAHGDNVASRDFLSRYRTMATSLGFGINT